MKAPNSRVVEIGREKHRVVYNRREGIYYLPGGKTTNDEIVAINTMARNVLNFKKVRAI